MAAVQHAPGVGRGATRAEPDPAPRPPGVTSAHRRRTERWELIGCALSGHFLVGTDVARITDDDRHLVRSADDGHRWHRCLRCDAWQLMPAPEAPTRRTCPSEDEIELPLRGRRLRDRYVLRLIAVERVLHVAIFLTASVALFVVARKRDVLDADFQRLISDLRGGGSVSGNGVIAEIGRFLTFSHRSLYTLAGVALVYAVFEGVEAVGLWMGKRWAEYLTFVATIVLIPLEVYDLTSRVSALKVATLVINVAIALYLLLSKRLFGLRGGARASTQE